MIKQQVNKWIDYVIKTAIPVLLAGVAFLGNAYVTGQTNDVKQDAQIIALSDKIKDVSSAPVQVKLNAKDIRQTKENLVELKLDVRELQKDVKKHHSESMSQMLDLKILLIQIKNK